MGIRHVCLIPDRSGAISLLNVEELGTEMKENVYQGHKYVYSLL